MRSSALNKLVCGLAAALLLSAASARARAPIISPCVCVPCGGQVECEPGSTGWCECRSNKCHGGCLRNDRNPRRLAAAVLTVIEGDEKVIQPEALQLNAPQYAQLLTLLLSKRDDEQTYRIEYGTRKIRFVLTPDMAEQLSAVAYDLQSIASGGTPTPSPQPSPAATPGPVEVGERLPVIKFLFGDGLLGFLTYVLLILMSGYVFSVTINRTLTYSAAQLQTRTYSPLLAEYLQDGRIRKALDLSDEFSNSHVARVVASGLRELVRQEEDPEASRHDPELFSNAMRRAAAEQAFEFEQGLSGLATVAWAAPLVGMFGLIVAFIPSPLGASSTAFDFAAPAPLYSGLFTLALGLLITLFATVARQRLSRKVEILVSEMNEAAADLSQRFRKNRGYGRELAT